MSDKNEYLGRRPSVAHYHKIREERIARLVTSDFYQSGEEFPASKAAEYLDMSPSACRDLLAWMGIPRRATKGAALYCKKPKSWLSKRWL